MRNTVMSDWEKLCFSCQLPAEENGEYVCRVSDPACLLHQAVRRGEAPLNALYNGVSPLRQDTCGVKDQPLFTSADGMIKFCEAVARFEDGDIKRGTDWWK